MTATPIIDPEGFLHEQLAQASPDLLRELLQTFVNALLSAQADSVCGAEFGARSEQRTNRRNGYRHRDLDTRVGTLDVAVPKLREGGKVRVREVLPLYQRPGGSVVYSGEPSGQLPCSSSCLTARRPYRLSNSDQPASLWRALVLNAAASGTAWPWGSRWPGSGCCTSSARQHSRPA